MTTEQAILYCEGLSKMALQTKSWLEHRVKQGRIALDTQIATIDGLINYAHNHQFVINSASKPLRVPDPRQPVNDKVSAHETVRKIKTLLSQLEERVYEVSMDKAREAIEHTNIEGT